MPTTSTTTRTTRTSANAAAAATAPAPAASARGTTTANQQGAANQASQQGATNQTTQRRLSAMDTYVPIVDDVQADEVAAEFPHTTLTKVEGEPTYEDFYVFREELRRNALSVWSPFGGGDCGHLGLVMSGQRYTTETGEVWSVPTSQGMFPNFAANATDTEKKRVVAEFVRDEKGIKTAKMVGKLLRNQLLEAVEEDYYMELEHAIYKYDRVTVFDLMEHLLVNYADIDDELIATNRAEFEKEPDMAAPIDVYFRKQERCAQFAEDGGVPISSADMVMQLQLHMGKTGMVNSAYTKWKARTAANRTWKQGKIFFRKAIKDVAKINKLAAGDGFTANAAIQKRQQTEDKVREEIADQLGEAFDNLAMAATAKQDTLESMAKSIADLTEANKVLTKANRDLAENLKKALAGTGGGGGGGGGDRNKKKKDQNKTTGAFPEWSDPDAYCWTCGYKLRDGHTSGNCKFRDNPGHQCAATRKNPMGGSKLNAGWGNKPDGTERE